MEYRTLGETDLRVSSIGLGCVTFGREIDREKSFQVLDYSVERGINLLDTAAAYGNGASEAVVGDWLLERGVRERVVLATKVHGSLRKKDILASIEESLRRLKTDRVDLFQLHLWSNETPLEETLETLDLIVKQGKARYIGCSNWHAWQLAKALLLSRERGWRSLESIQPPYNLVQREIEPDLLPLCADQRIGVISYSPLAAGFLTGKYRRDQQVPQGTRFDVIPAHQPIYFTDRGFTVLEHLEQMALETGRSIIQLALVWVLRQPRITSVLFGARNCGHVDQVFDAQEAARDETLVLSGL